MKEVIKKDFDLCSELCGKITAQYGGHCPIDEYPEVERVIPLVWTVTGIIENGGFRYLFSSTIPGDTHWGHAIKAFSQIGCKKVAETIQRALCIFPDCIPQEDTQERLAWFEKQPKELISRLNSEFYEELDIITICMARYIRENKLDKKFGIEEKEVFEPQLAPPTNLMSEDQKAFLRNKIQPIKLLLTMLQEGKPPPKNLVRITLENLDAIEEFLND